MRAVAHRGIEGQPAAAWGIRPPLTPPNGPTRRALELLRDAAGQRPAVVQDAAVEAAAGVGEADLRRLKRQFSSLKNTFLHYEVKNEFLAGAPVLSARGRWLRSRYPAPPLHLPPLLLRRRTSTACRCLKAGSIPPI